MLILAGVSVTTVQNGDLFGKTREARDKTNDAKVEEELSLLAAESLMSKKELEELRANIESQEWCEEATLDGDGIHVVTKGNKEYTVRNGGVSEYAPPQISLINFTIDGIAYQAENGMTWEEWCMSQYNDGTLLMPYNGEIVGIGPFDEGVVRPNSLDDDPVNPTDTIMEIDYYASDGTRPGGHEPGGF